MLIYLIYLNVNCELQVSKLMFLASKYYTTPLTKTDIGKYSIAKTLLHLVSSVTIISVTKLVNPKIMQTITAYLPSAGQNASRTRKRIIYTIM